LYSVLYDCLNRQSSYTEEFLYSLRKILCFFVLKSKIRYISTFYWFYFKIYVQTAETLFEEEKKKKIKSCQLERLNILSLSAVSMLEILGKPRGQQNMVVTCEQSYRFVFFGFIALLFIRLEIGEKFLVSRWEIHIVHRKNDFAEISKNLAKYRSENNGTFKAGC